VQAHVPTCGGTATALQQRLIDAQQSIEADYGRLRDAQARYRQLMQAARDRAGGDVPRSYRFRGLRPLFHFDALSLQGQGMMDGAEALATVNGEGLVCMRADIAW
jgi:hypothetical protein